MEIVRCPNPQCGRRILDWEMTDTEWMAFEMKCPHCGKVIRLYCGPDKIEAKVHKRKKRRE